MKDRAEELAKWCADNNCPAHENCVVCMYEKGRAEAIKENKEDAELIRQYKNISPQMQEAVREIIRVTQLKGGE